MNLNKLITFSFAKLKLSLKLLTFFSHFVFRKLIYTKICGQIEKKITSKFASNLIQNKRNCPKFILLPKIIYRPFIYVY